MKLIIFFLSLSFTIGIQANEGGDLFKINCAACHTIGGGRLVGPDLKNISQQRDAEYLLRFITSSQSFVKSGNADAIKIYNEYGKILMPDAQISESQITEVLNYIKGVSTGEVTESVAVAIVVPLASTNQDNILNGRKLFSGQKRLENSGSSCLSCHNVKDDLAYPGGNFAKELTDSYSLMGSAGVLAIIRNSPFPAMAQSYVDHPLTESEIIDLSAYLKSVSENSIYQHPRDFSMTFFYLGQFAFLLFLGAIMILFWKRKKDTVNKEIYNRQS